MKTRLTVIVALLLISPAIHAVTITVPGTSNPWLAGMPNGTTATGGSPNSGDVDTAPFQSPALFMPVVQGSLLSFTVTGSVNNNPGSSGLTPDGGNLQPHTPENGIAAFNGPINSLVGVFLAASQPNPPEPAQFDYLPSSLLVEPGLRQVFFIGNGRADTGPADVQQFLAPLGATRLFLGSMDGSQWNNNSGSFIVTADSAPGLGVPDGGSTALLLLLDCCGVFLVKASETRAD